MERPVRSGLRNRLLGAMSEADFALIAPHLEPAKLEFRKRIQSSNRKIKAIYFPDSGLASVVAGGGGERLQAEVGVIGHEGMTGLASILGAERSPCEVFIQVEGHGHCIEPAHLNDVMEQSPTLSRTLLLFAHTFLVQASYTALANAKATLEERLARWLLMAQDRIHTKELVLTHEFLALMLGVRRAGVSVALQHYETQGLIATGRGSVTIEDRDGLEEAANGFYGPPEAEYERLFPSAAQAVRNLSAR
jgi:CRP-like cAMP-binding protein